METQNRRMLGKIVGVRSNYSIDAISESNQRLANHKKILESNSSTNLKVDPLVAMLANRRNRNVSHSFVISFRTRRV